MWPLVLQLSRRSKLVSAAVLVLALNACVGDDATGSGNATLDTESVQLADGALLLDIETGAINGVDQFDFVAFWADVEGIQAGAEESLQACMADGLPYAPLTGITRGGAGLDDGGYAAEHGFGITPDHLSSSAPPRQRLDEAVEAAIVADEVTWERAHESCRRAAYGEYDALVGPLIERSSELNDARSAFAADERVIDHYASWRECMAGQGLAFTAPIAAREAFAERLAEIEIADRSDRVASLRDLVAEEIAVARATVGCGESPRIGLADELVEVWIDHVSAALG